MDYDKKYLKELCIEVMDFGSRETKSLATYSFIELLATNM